MSEPRKPGLRVMLQALRDLIEAVPEKGSDVDWEDLGARKKIAVDVMNLLDKIFSREPLARQIDECQGDWPLIYPPPP